MKNYNLPFFGELDLEALEDYYKVEFEYKNKSIDIDLNFNEEKIEKDRLDPATSFLQNIPNIIELAYKAILDDFKAGGTTKEYIDHHLEVIPRGELDDILKNVDKGLSIEDQLFSLLHLYRIGIYPSYDDSYLIMDHNLGVGVTNYIVVVNINENGIVDCIDMES